MTRLAFVLVLAVLTCVAPARAQALGQEGAGPSELPATGTLADVLRLAEERSPRTIASRAEARAVAADRITAATLPNPSVSYGGVHLLSGLSTGAVTQHQIVVEQPVLMFGQRRARVDMADLNLR